VDLCGSPFLFAAEVIVNGVGNLIFEVLSEYGRRVSIRQVPIDVNILRDIIKDVAELKTLAIFAVDVDTPNLLGNVKFYYADLQPGPHDTPTTAYIRVKASLNACWTRFVICKELCHCVLDTEQDRVSTVIQALNLVEELATKPWTPNSPPMLSEKVAEVVALELLCPLELREEFVEPYRKGEVTANQLALRFRIPQDFIEVAMGEVYIDSIRSIRRGKLVDISQIPPVPLRVVGS
jgi:hypothetical protein